MTVRVGTATPYTRLTWETLKDAVGGVPEPKDETVCVRATDWSVSPWRA